MTARPKLHLIHGFTGAGKTTYAKKLAAAEKALRLSPDDWMCALFGTNPPAEHFRDYDDRIKAVMWQVAADTLATGRDVILDYGFWTRAARDDYRARALSLGATPVLHNLQCPDDVMHARVLKRTEELPLGALVIDANAIAEFRKRFEPVAADEDCIVVDSAL